MTTLKLRPAAAAPKPAATAPADHPPGRQPWAVIGLAVVGGLVLGWQGGWMGALGTACAISAGLGLPWLRRQGDAGGDGAGPLPGRDAESPAGGRAGVEVMVSRVVPVWGHQLDVTRETASQGLGQWQAGFAQLADGLATLSTRLNALAPSAETRDVEGVLAGAADALALLLAPSTEALAQRDAAVAELGHCAAALDELRHAGQAAREIGKHTRLVAFNASIEAQRHSGGAANGAVAIAMETRTLAGRISDVGTQVGQIVDRLESTLQRCQLQGQVHDTTPDELRLALNLRAREALSRLQLALGGTLDNSAQVLAACQALRQTVGGLAGQGQLGDQLDQMLATVATDMAGFVRWVQRHPYATQSDAADWLTKLEASYTTTAQRARHHGNVHIERLA